MRCGSRVAGELAHCYHVSTLVALLLATAPLLADDEAAPEYTDAGADTCLTCHADEAILSIFRTPHGHPTDPNAPFAQAQCESCHGPGAAHGVMRLRRGRERPPMKKFGAEADTPVAVQNETCLGCHQGELDLAWHGSAHDLEFTSCADCHQLHAPQDRVLLVHEQAEVCYTCHQAKRAANFKPSIHPVRQGKISCSSCHNPHGSQTDNLLARDTVNQVCFDCHAEKRGPFLWEHAPVAEDCTLCHDPHGSNNAALLTRRPPLLCQQCHSQAGHPSTPFTEQGLPGNNPSAFVVGGSCLNCHSRIHGSNHPSGVNLAR